MRIRTAVILILFLALLQLAGAFAAGPQPGAEPAAPGLITDVRILVISRPGIIVRPADPGSCWLNYELGRWLVYTPATGAPALVTESESRAIDFLLNDCQ